MPLRGPAPEVWIHHTAAPFSTTEPLFERSEMRQTQKFHQETRGWNDIAYSFVVFPSGRVYEGRGWGVVGGHTEGYNSRSHGICFAGNFETQHPTVEALEAARALIHEGVQRGYVSRPFKLGGHRDTKATACPGKNLYPLVSSLAFAPQPPEVTPVPDNPKLVSPILGFYPIIGPDGICTGYYYVSLTGEVHGHGPGAKFHGRSEAPAS